MFQDVWEVVMAVNPMADLAFLKGRCLCADRRDCWHGPCELRRQLRSGRVLLENGAGYVRLARTGEVNQPGIPPQSCRDPPLGSGVEAVAGR